MSPGKQIGRLMIEWTGNQFKVGDISFQAIGDLEERLINAFGCAEITV